MSSIRIGNAQRTLESADPEWINQQINGLRRDGLAICVIVNISEGDVNMRLQSEACARGGGGQWQPNRREEAVFGLWKKCHLDEMEPAGGNVVAFVKQLRGLL